MKVNLNNFKYKISYSYILLCAKIAKINKLEAFS